MQREHLQKKQITDNKVEKMLKLLHLTYGKKYHVEDGMIKLLMMKADERHTYFNFVEEDFINLVREVCLASGYNFLAATF